MDMVVNLELESAHSSIGVEIFKCSLDQLLLIVQLGNKGASLDCYHSTFN